MPKKLVGPEYEQFLQNELVGSKTLLEQRRLEPSFGIFPFAMRRADTTM